MISGTSGGIRPAAAQVGGVGEQRPHPVRRVVRVLDHPELVPLGVKLVNELGGDLHLPAIDIELTPLPLWLVVALTELPGDLGFLAHRLLGRDHLLVACGHPLVVHRHLGHDGRVAVELGVGEEAGGLGEVEDVEEELAVVVPEPGAATDDLLELHDGIDDAGKDDVLAGRGVHARREQLGRGEDDRRGRLHVLEPAQVTDADVALVGGHPADVIGVLLDQVGVEVVQFPPHLVGVFLVHAEHDGLGEAVGPLEEVGDAAGDGFGAGAEGDDPLEILGLVLLVGDLPPVAVQLAPARSPAERVVGRDDAVDAVGGEEAVLDALAQGIGVDGVAEVGVSVHVHVALGRGGHPELEGGLEILQDFPPTALVPGTAPVALVHDDEVEEVGRILAVEPWSAFVLGDRLVDGEVHLPPLADLRRWRSSTGHHRRG